MYALCILHHAPCIIADIYCISGDNFYLFNGLFLSSLCFFFILFLHFDDESKLFITLRQSVKSVSSHIRNRDKILMFQWNGMECAPFYPFFSFDLRARARERKTCTQLLFCVQKSNHCLLNCKIRIRHSITLKHT